MALKAQAVLFRSSSHSAQLELELARRSIPFVKFGGLKFLEAAHVKDVLSRPALGREPAQPAWPDFARCGCCPASARRRARAAARCDGTRRPIRLRHCAAFDAAALPPRRTGRAVRDLLRRARASAIAWPADIERVVALVRAAARAHATTMRTCAAATSRSSRRSPSTYPSRERFLTELTLDPPRCHERRGRRAARDDDYLILSTIHSAKGQEWKAVHVLNVVDGCIPSDMAPGTQRRASRRSGGCCTWR